MGILTKKVLFLRNPDSSVAKESTCNAGDPSCSIPGSGRPPVEVIGYVFQYSWASLVAQLVKSLHVVDLGLIPELGRSLEKAKAAHSSIVA